ncbi:hypothetical protein RB195_026237 [Necator americanus]
MQITGTEGWKCGIGPVSSTISYIIAFPSDITEIDKCCIEHDTLVDGLHLPRKEADQIFCECLATKDSWYIKHVVKPLFCTSVVLYTKWFDNDKGTKPVNQQIIQPDNDKPQERVEPSLLRNLERL